MNCDMSSDKGLDNHDVEAQGKRKRELEEADDEPGLSHDAQMLQVWRRRRRIRAGAYEASHGHHMGLAFVVEYRASVSVSGR